MAEILLDESGYTQFWMNDKSPEAPGRLENLKELVNAIAEFENLPSRLSMSVWSWRHWGTTATRWSAL